MKSFLKSVARKTLPFPGAPSQDVEINRLLVSCKPCKPCLLNGRKDLMIRLNSSINPTLALPLTKKLFSEMNLVKQQKCWDDLNEMYKEWAHVARVWGPKECGQLGSHGWTFERSSGLDAWVFHSADNIYVSYPPVDKKTLFRPWSTRHWVDVFRGFIFLCDVNDVLQE